ncbi:histidine kinase [Streptomyces gobiensis]|nr:histidine kinase [Streptomyces gobiensis]UGY90966.1 histidine kinase [Streptomyces gobiensis]
MADLPDSFAARARRWLRQHPLALDALIAAVVYALILVNAAAEPYSPDGGPRFGARDVSTLTVVLAALAAAALVARRRFALPVLVLTSTLTLIDLIVVSNTREAGDRRAALVLAVVIALYTVATRTDRHTTLRVGVVTVLGVTGAGMIFGAQPWYAQENLGIFAWTGMAAGIGDAVRSRRAVMDTIRERAERAERTREEEARRRVAEERVRIARELHDVVAHHIALVNVQAGVAAHVMDSRPDQAKEALGHIREASRHALDELQTTVGLLRQSGDPAAPTEPAPGLGVLDELVEGFVRSGLTVTLDAPVAGPLPSAVDLTAYRVVQEALTNVHKHAGPGTHVRVRIVRGGGAANAALEITVHDDGPSGRASEYRADSADHLGGGHGLLGMRERAAALSGSCEAGPDGKGGFRVHVRLPLQTARPGGNHEETAL